MAIKTRKTERRRALEHLKMIQQRREFSNELQQHKECILELTKLNSEIQQEIQQIRHQIQELRTHNRSSTFPDFF
jgi:uncharacterized lipoprotein YmbA